MIHDTANAIHEWLSQPFNDKGSALNWIAFVGLLVVAAFLWNMVLLAMIKGVEQV